MIFGYAAAALLAAAQPAPVADPVAANPAAVDPVAAEIAQLEQQWGQAFVTRDFAFIERIVAPEYRLAVANPNGHSITLRPEWMANARAFVSHAFEVETLDVNRAGDTAVASARGIWTVSRRPGKPERMRFFVTDTWVRRGGQWQVIHRYSHRLGVVPAPAALVPDAPGERGR